MIWVYWTKAGRFKTKNIFTIPWDDLHRDGGPAFMGGIYFEWRQNGKCHRETGPAAGWYTGDKMWYLYDKKLTEEEFKSITDPLQRKLVWG
jgi:hypothetical protein